VKEIIMRSYHGLNGTTSGRAAAEQIITKETHWALSG
jgi:hypothetical protein